MSDNTSDEEQQQQMEEISICADIWLEVFAFVSSVELRQLMALISDRFDALVDVHFKHKKWSLGTLQILRSTDGIGAQIVNNTCSGEVLPIPRGPLPDNVIGFEKLEISYIDRSVIEFLRRIRRLFNSTGPNVEIDNASNKLTINLDDMDIGDGMLDANDEEGPSEPKK
uniref:F-box domain-containing protein n=1 Tax=Globodera rostochiensis TaxID=31243 RepID=A0A914HFG3_GLORO